MHNQVTEDLRLDVDNKVGENLIQKRETNEVGTDMSDCANQTSTRKQLEFKIDENPPWQITLLYSFQYLLSIIGGPLGTTYLIHMNLCTEGRDSNLLFAQLFSTALVMIGVATFMQTTFGSRLPILQGSAAIYVVCITAMMQTDTWKCPELYMHTNNSLNENITSGEVQPWIPRLREITGCLMLASTVEVLFGCTGIVGFLLNFIGPLTVGVVISLIGLCLVEGIAVGAGQQWGIAMMEAVLFAAFSMVLGKFDVPVPTLDLKQGCKLTKLRLFKIFPFLFATSITWLLCFILTTTNVFPSDPSERGYLARTDAKTDAIVNANWFYFPYPGQWGKPTITTAGVFIGMLGATITSILESVGDYYAAARVCQVPMPPKHAVNRGIAMEGLASIIASLCGAPNPTTSFSHCIGLITLTGIASRIVLQVFAIITILLGIFGKFGAVLASIPSPIIAGSTLVSLGMVTGMGISMLQFADLNSPRNLFVIGVSFMMAFMLPSWVNKNPGALNTGVSTLDHTLAMLLRIGICVGGVTAVLLDNIIPGTRRERGLHMYDHRSPEMYDEGSSKQDASTEAGDKSVYDLPIVGSWIQRHRVFSYMPFMSTYRERKCRCCKWNAGKTNDDDIV